MAHFALQKLHILPSVLAAMEEREKAFVYGSIQLRIEEEKKGTSKLHSPNKRIKRGGRG